MTAHPPIQGRRRVGAHAGVTLLELMVAASILSMLAVMMFMAFQHTAGIRTKLTERQERDHAARVTISRLTRDLRGAYLSAHVNTNPTQMQSLTAFVAREEGAGTRADWSAFTHRRLLRAAHEGDACEVGYRVMSRRNGNQRDLMRREAPRVDAEPSRGGVLDVLFPDVQTFELRFYDKLGDRWLDSWDTMTASAQGGRLPTRIRIRLTFVHNERPVTYRTEAGPMIVEILRFGLPIDYR